MRLFNFAMAAAASLCAVLTITGLATALAESSPRQFPAIFNFGDSNSDTGAISAALDPLQPPYGNTFFGQPAGRYSDGRLIIDFFAESFEIPYLSAYLNSIGANFSHGANFATSGSTILQPNLTYFQSFLSPFSLDIQLMQFLQFKPRSLSFANKNKGNILSSLLPKEEIFCEALYTFDIGQNDLTYALFLTNMTFQQIKDFIPLLIQKLITVIKTIYSEGGRNFWIHNMEPLGCFPFMVQSFMNGTSDQIDQSGCAIPPNQLSQIFNSMLKDEIHQLQEDFPLAKFTYVDIYTIKYSLISQATKYGFEHPFEICCSDHGKLLSCGDTLRLKNGTKILVGKSCQDPQKRISWDGGHSTEAANAWVFDQISQLYLSKL